MIVLIPAYKPDDILQSLIHALKQHPQLTLVVVNDGNGSEFDALFAQLEAQGCTVLNHKSPSGRGGALKTGFQYILDNCPGAHVVTASTNGQYSAENVLALCDALEEQTEKIIIGVRQYADKIPALTKAAIKLNRGAFTMASGKTLSDAHTELIGYKHDMLPWLLKIKGEGYNYELNLLLDAVTEKVPIFEKDIFVQFIPKKQRHHRRKIKDSIKMYWPIVKYSLSSLTAGAVDFIAVLVLELFFRKYVFTKPLGIDFDISLFLAVSIGRIITCVVNYYMNKHLVFTKKEADSIKNSFFRYTVLTAGMILANFLLLVLLRDVLRIPLTLSKLVADNALYFPAYWVQRKYVFK